MTVVIDCNIFVMCLTTRSPYHLIFQSLVGGKFNIAITNDILLEYEEIIQRKYSVSASKALISLLLELPNVQFINQTYKWQLIEVDADDNKYCDCAIAGKAEFIVTEDRHFDILNTIPFPAISTINIDEFLALLAN